MAESKVKRIQTTLDALPFGELPDHPLAGLELRRMTLPKGVTHGMLFGDILRIAWPSFLELLLTQLTSMADQMMVGNLPGEVGVQALSAVGITILPKFLMMTMITALNVGSTAVAARFRGMGDRDRVNEVLRQALVLNLLLSVLFMGLGLVLAPTLMRMMGGAGLSDEAFGFAVTYFRIQMYGFVPLCMTFTVTALLRGIGDTKNPFYYNTLANVVNVLFNYLLIFGRFGFPRLEVAGASLATVIGQTAAFLVAMRLILDRKRYLHLDNGTRFRFDPVIVKNIVRIGVPSMIEQLIMRLGLIIYNRTVTDLGDVAYATHQICSNIQTMSFMVGQAFANAATTLVGQSLGRRRYDAAMQYARHTEAVGVIVSLFLGFGLIFFGRTVVSLYNRTPEIVSLGGRLLIMAGVIQPLQALQFILSGALRGAGDTKFSAFSMLVTVLILRSGLAILLVTYLKMGLVGAWYAMVADQIVRDLMIILYFRSGRWSRIRLKEV